MNQTKYTPTFVDLVGDPDVFFSEYFNKKILLRKGAVKDRDLLGPADLDTLLNSEAIRPPYIGVTKSGDAVHPRTYTEPLRIQRDTVTDRILPRRVAEHFKTGATVTWTSLNHIFPHMRDLAAMLSTTFSARCDVVAFATPAGRKGYKPHQDSVDLFIIQTHGTKHWAIWQPQEQRSGEAEWFKLEELGEPFMTFDMEPGDVLYLPYCSPHVAAANDNLSIHLSVMLRPRRWAELLQELVSVITRQDQRFLNYPYLSTSNADLEREFHDAVDLLHGQLHALSAEEVVDLAQVEEISVGTKSISLFEQQALADTFDGDTSVWRDPDVPFSVGDETEKGSGKRKVVINGTTYAFPEAWAVAVDDIPESPTKAGQLVESFSESENAAFVRNLLQLGVVQARSADSFSAL